MEELFFVKLMEQVMVKVRLKVLPRVKAQVRAVREVHVEEILMKAEVDEVVEVRAEVEEAGEGVEVEVEVGQGGLGPVQLDLELV